MGPSFYFRIYFDFFICKKFHCDPLSFKLGQIDPSKILIAFNFRTRFETFFFIESKYKTYFIKFTYMKLWNVTDIQKNGL